MGCPKLRETDDRKPQWAMRQLSGKKFSRVSPVSQTHPYQHENLCFPQSAFICRRSHQKKRCVSPQALTRALPGGGVLIARAYEVFPLMCPTCAGQMRIIAFITDGAEVRRFLAHIGANSQAPRITPAHRPPLREDCGAPVGVGVEVEPYWNMDVRLVGRFRIRQDIEPVCGPRCRVGPLSARPPIPRQGGGMRCRASAASRRW